MGNPLRANSSDFPIIRNPGRNLSSCIEKQSGFVDAVVISLRGHPAAPVGAGVGESAGPGRTRPRTRCAESERLDIGPVTTDHDHLVVTGRKPVGAGGLKSSPHEFDQSAENRSPVGISAVDEPRNPEPGQEVGPIPARFQPDSSPTRIRAAAAHCPDQVPTRRQAVVPGGAVRRCRVVPATRVEAIRPGTSAQLPRIEWEPTAEGTGSSRITARS